VIAGRCVRIEVCGHERRITASRKKVERADRIVHLALLDISCRAAAHDQADGYQ
jgi:hypothetical protein